MLQTEITWVADYPIDKDDRVRVYGCILLDNPQHIQEMAWQIRIFHQLRDALAALEFARSTCGGVRAFVAVTRSQKGFLSPVWWWGNPNTIYPGFAGPIAWGGHVVTETIRTLENDPEQTLLPGRGWFAYCDIAKSTLVDFYPDSMPAHNWPRLPLMVKYESSQHSE